MAAADEFWPGFGDDDGVPAITCDTTGSLAQDVLNKYGIPCSDGLGGSLPGLDIKHMDAMQVIKLSLLEATANSGRDIYEPIMNAEGQVEFKKIGDGEGPSDEYYEIQTGQYKEECPGVLVQGKNPMPVRRAMNWQPIWGDGTNKKIYDTGFMHNSCAEGAFNQYATIVYDDPQLTTTYNDGIDNLYIIMSPWETLIGYAQYITWPDWQTDSDANITFADSAKILIEIPLDLGELQRRPQADPELAKNPACFEGQGDELPEDVGVVVTLPEHFRFESIRETKIDKFIGITGVYVVGRAIDHLITSPKDNESSATPGMESAKVWASINKSYDEVISLEQGTHYVINYTGIQSSDNPKVVFADNSRISDPLKIPKGGSLTFYIEPDCEYSIDENGKSRTSETGVVLPTGQTSGILVKQIFVAVELQTPSIIVYHPDGWNKKAYEIASNLDYQVCPLIVEDKPAPIAFNGTLLDQDASKQDHDPTTAQDFSETDLERAMDDLDGGNGLSLTLSFLNEEQVISLSGALQDHMDSGTGVVSTYVCGPSATPELGANGPNGGVVNSIVYSYQDSNSYTISVECGPILVGGQMAQVDGGPALKITEAISAKGTIIEDLGNNVYFKVSIDGFGDRIAVNMIPEVIRVGDKVSVSVHNNPVEA